MTQWRNDATRSHAAATVLFVLVLTFVPGVQMFIKTTPLSGGTWVLVIAAALTGTPWIEVKKWIVLLLSARKGN